MRVWFGTAPRGDKRHSCKLFENQTQFMDDKSLVINKEIEYCATHPVYFAKNYGHIEDHDKPEQIIQPFTLWPAQKETMRTIHHSKKSIILKARQLGISWLVLHYAVTVLFSPGKLIIGLSRSETEAMELIRRAANVILKNSGLAYEKHEVPAGWQGPVYESTALKLTLHRPGKADSVMQCFASNENSARSFTADLLIFDEWAFQQFARQIWAAAYPVINRPNSGQVIGISTIKRGTLFEELFTEEGNGFEKIFLPWYTDPSRTKEWYEDTKRTLKDEMQAEYPATIDEALTIPGGAFFPEVTHDSIETDKELEGNTKTYFVMDYGLDMLAAYWVNMDTLGRFQIVKEHCEKDLTIGAASQVIKDLSRDYEIDLWLAPSDIWNRDQVTGRSRADLFADNGINLTKVSRDLVSGCASLKELTYHEPGEKSKLTILNKCAPIAYKCLTKIQKDEKKPNIYSNDPHSLTHSVDALRYLAVYWTTPAESRGESKKRKWTADMYEDYENADEQLRAYLITKWGEPT